MANSIIDQQRDNRDFIKRRVSFWGYNPHSSSGKFWCFVDEITDPYDVTDDVAEARKKNEYLCRIYGGVKVGNPFE